MAEISRAAAPSISVTSGSRMRAWIRTRLWAQVLTGMMLGFAIGIVLGPDTGWPDPGNLRSRPGAGWPCRGRFSSA